MRAIVFDLDGTLLTFTRDYRAVLADAIQDVTGERLETRVDVVEAALLDYLDDCRPNPYRRAFAALDRPADPATFADALRAAEVEACRPPENAHDDLARLSERYALGVLTNGVAEWQRHKLRAHDLAAYFEAVVASSDVGANKPDPAPFEAAERRLQADAYAMVGDADADVEGARQAGWTPHRYTGDGFGDLPGAIQWR